MGDLPLIEAVIHEEAGAWEAFVRRTSSLMVKLCAAVFPERERETECLTLFARLRAQNFALLRRFDGRGTLTTYLTLTLSDMLARRIRELFDRDANWAWDAFERFFRKDMMQVVARHFPVGKAYTDGSTQEDRYQELCLLLMAQDYQHIKAFEGHGSFPGYIRRIVRNLCVDLLRREEGRRRLPEGIQKLPALQQEVFKYIYWDGYEEEAALHTLVPQGYTRAQFDGALAQVREIVALEEIHPRRPVMVRLSGPNAATPNQSELPDSRLAPEQALMELQEQLAQEQLLTALQESLLQLPADMQLYIRLRFFTTPQKPPREIARLMQRSEADIYRLRQQAVATLKSSLRARGLWENAGSVRLQLSGEA
jgi:RNA polymerase primary sigma factor